MFDGDAVRELADRFAKPTEIGAGFVAVPKDWTVKDPASMVAPGPKAQVIQVAMLGAVRDYLQANRDALELSKVHVHVDTPSKVWVAGPLDLRSRAREYFVCAQAADLTDGFIGKFMSLEDMVVGLQARFVDAEDRGRLLALLSNVKHETVKSSMDDGVTQVVQARAGVALVSDVAVPNPVRLRAYRTFRDIQQPVAPFIVRVQGGRSGGLPEAALFEGDGGAWRLTATERVSEWLKDNLPVGVAVLA